MKPFVIRLVLFMGLQFLILLTVYAYYPGPKNDYVAATIDKHERARKSAAVPRLFLVGGSNVAFGINSPKLKRELGYEPVNLSLTGALGLEFVLAEANDLARAGDVIVVSPEYEHLWQDLSNVQVVAGRLLHFRPQSSRYLSWRSVKQFCDQGLTEIHRVLMATVGRRDSMPQLYRRSGFNVMGDFVAHHGLQPEYDGDPPQRKSRAIDASYVGRTIEQLNEFARSNRARGVRVFFSHPPISESGFANAEEQIEFVARRIEQDLRIPVLNDVHELVLPDSYFFDTRYHLTAEGKSLRTELLSDRLGTAASPQTYGMTRRAGEMVRDGEKTARPEMPSSRR